MPVDGAIVERQFLVRIGYVGQAPHGPAEDSGISFAPAAQPANNARFYGRDQRPTMVSDGTGLHPAGEHRSGPHFALLIDDAMPAPGSPFTADARHIPFPRGIPQMTLTLEPGQHSLTLLTIDPEGEISPRSRASATLITVR